MNTTHETTENATIDTFQDLLSINIDSQKGFQEAAKSTKDISLQQLFTEYGARRAENAQELRQYIVAAGREAKESGSVAGKIHRWWIDAKQALVSDDAQSILNEAERGEDSVKRTYERALQSVNDAPARAVVERQYRNVKDAHDRVKELRDSYKNSRRNPE